MDQNVRIRQLVEKLAHPIPEIRLRSLENLKSKLKGALLISKEQIGNDDEIVATLLRALVLAAETRERGPQLSSAEQRRRVREVGDDDDDEDCKKEGNFQDSKVNEMWCTGLAEFLKVISSVPRARETLRREGAVPLLQRLLDREDATATRDSTEDPKTIRNRSFFGSLRAILENVLCVCSTNTNDESKETTSSISRSSLRKSTLATRGEGVTQEMWRFPPIRLTLEDEQRLFNVCVQFKLALPTPTKQALTRLRVRLMDDFPPEIVLQRPAIFEHLLASLQLHRLDTFDSSRDRRAESSGLVQDTIGQEAFDTLDRLGHDLCRSVGVVAASISDGGSRAEGRRSRGKMLHDEVQDTRTFRTDVAATADDDEDSRTTRRWRYPYPPSTSVEDAVDANPGALPPRKATAMVIVAASKMLKRSEWVDLALRAMRAWLPLLRMELPLSVGSRENLENSATRRSSGDAAEGSVSSFLIEECFESLSDALVVHDRHVSKLLFSGTCEDDDSSEKSDDLENILGVLHFVSDLLQTIPVDRLDEAEEGPRRVRLPDAMISILRRLVTSDWLAEYEHRSCLAKSTRDRLLPYLEAIDRGSANLFRANCIVVDAAKSAVARFKSEGWTALTRDAREMSRSSAAVDVVDSLLSSFEAAAPGLAFDRELVVSMVPVVLTFAVASGAAVPRSPEDVEKVARIGDRCIALLERMLRFNASIFVRRFAYQTIASAVALEKPWDCYDRASVCSSILGAPNLLQEILAQGAHSSDEIVSEAAIRILCEIAPASDAECRERSRAFASFLPLLQVLALKADDFYEDICRKSSDSATNSSISARRLRALFEAVVAAIGEDKKKTADPGYRIRKNVLRAQQLFHRQDAVRRDAVASIVRERGRSWLPSSNHTFVSPMLTTAFNDSDRSYVGDPIGTLPPLPPTAVVTFDDGAAAESNATQLSRQDVMNLLRLLATSSASDLDYAASCDSKRVSARRRRFVDTRLHDAAAQQLLAAVGCGSLDNLLRTSADACGKIVSSTVESLRVLLAMDESDDEENERIVDRLRLVEFTIARSNGSKWLENSATILDTTLDTLLRAVFHSRVVVRAVAAAALARLCFAKSLWEPSSVRDALTSSRNAVTTTNVLLVSRAVYKSFLLGPSAGVSILVERTYDEDDDAGRTDFMQSRRELRRALSYRLPLSESFSKNEGGAPSSIAASVRAAVANLRAQRDWRGYLDRISHIVLRWSARGQERAEAAWGAFVESKGSLALRRFFEIAPATAVDERMLRIVLTLCAEMFRSANAGKWSSDAFATLRNLVVNRLAGLIVPPPAPTRDSSVVDQDTTTFYVVEQLRRCVSAHDLVVSIATSTRGFDAQQAARLLPSLHAIARSSSLNNSGGDERIVSRSSLAMDWSYRLRVSALGCIFVLLRSENVTARTFEGIIDERVLATIAGRRLADDGRSFADGAEAKAALRCVQILRRKYEEQNEIARWTAVGKSAHAKGSSALYSGEFDGGDDATWCLRMTSDRESSVRQVAFSVARSLALCPRRALFRRSLFQLARGRVCDIDESSNVRSVALCTLASLVRQPLEISRSSGTGDVERSVVLATLVATTTDLLSSRSFALACAAATAFDASLLVAPQPSFALLVRRNRRRRRSLWDSFVEQLCVSDETDGVGVNSSYLRTQTCRLHASTNLRAFITRRESRNKLMRWNSVRSTLLVLRRSMSVCDRAMLSDALVIFDEDESHDRSQTSQRRTWLRSAVPTLVRNVLRVFVFLRRELGEDNRSITADDVRGKVGIASMALLADVIHRHANDAVAPPSHTGAAATDLADDYGSSMMHCIADAFSRARLVLSDVSVNTRRCIDTLNDAATAASLLTVIASNSDWARLAHVSTTTTSDRSGDFCVQRVTQELHGCFCAALEVRPCDDTIPAHVSIPTNADDATTVTVRLIRVVATALCSLLETNAVAKRSFVRCEGVAKALRALEESHREILAVQKSRRPSSSPLLDQRVSGRLLAVLGVVTSACAGSGAQNVRLASARSGIYRLLNRMWSVIEVMNLGAEWFGAFDRRVVDGSVKSSSSSSSLPQIARLTPILRALVNLLGVEELAAVLEKAPHDEKKSEEEERNRWVAGTCMCDNEFGSSLLDRLLALLRPPPRGPMSSSPPTLRAPPGLVVDVVAAAAMHRPCAHHILRSNFVAHSIDRWQRRCRSTAGVSHQLARIRIVLSIARHSVCRERLLRDRSLLPSLRQIVALSPTLSRSISEIIAAPIRLPPARSESPPLQSMRTRAATAAVALVARLALSREGKTSALTNGFVEVFDAILQDAVESTEDLAAFAASRLGFLGQVICALWALLHHHQKARAHLRGLSRGLEEKRDTMDALLCAFRASERNNSSEEEKRISSRNMHPKHVAANATRALKCILSLIGDDQDPFEASWTSSKRP